MTFVLGLTGSIGMGKSTTAGLFLDQGCAVWDADAAVHRLYGANGAALEEMQIAFPEAVENNMVSRDRLRSIIAEDQTALGRIEAIIHPLVARDRHDFIEKSNADIVVLDIPLLLENGLEKEMDAVVVVTAPPETQRERVLAREGMTEERFEFILSRQMPDADKRPKADYVVITDTVDHAREQVERIVTDIRERIENA
ncbi:dephospho-CoA kinase [Roseovarius sp. E0-M6]|uniref:dephospho-CoA kinase n=1 Tax=Roseovarius sp. E0-M6 TaxID=3127118 RepID=UPI00300FFA53